MDKINDIGVVIFYVCIFLVYTYANLLLYWRRNVFFHRRFFYNLFNLFYYLSFGAFNKVLILIFFSLFLYIQFWRSAEISQIPYWTLQISY